MPPFYQMRLSNERLTRDNMQSCLIVVLFLVNRKCGSYTIFRYIRNFFFDVYPKDFRHQSRLNFCCLSECHCQIQNSAFSRDLAVVKHESETRAHIKMKNTKNTYVFALRKISSVGTYFLMSLVKQ